jgi:hypothetical protein
LTDGQKKLVLAIVALVAVVLIGIALDVARVYVGG